MCGLVDPLVFYNLPAFKIIPSATPLVKYKQQQSDVLVFFSMIVNCQVVIRWFDCRIMIGVFITLYSLELPTIILVK